MIEKVNLKMKIFRKDYLKINNQNDIDFSLNSSEGNCFTSASILSLIANKVRIGKSKEMPFVAY